MQLQLHRQAIKLNGFKTTNKLHTSLSLQVISSSAVSQQLTYSEVIEVPWLHYCHPLSPAVRAQCLVTKAIC